MRRFMREYERNKPGQTQQVQAIGRNTLFSWFMHRLPGKLRYSKLISEAQDFLQLLLLKCCRKWLSAQILFSYSWCGILLPRIWGTNAYTRVRRAWCAPHQDWLPSACCMSWLSPLQSRSLIFLCLTPRSSSTSLRQLLWSIAQQPGKTCKAM